VLITASRNLSLQRCAHTEPIPCPLRPLLCVVVGGWYLSNFFDWALHTMSHIRTNRERCQQVPMSSVACRNPPGSVKYQRLLSLDSVAKSS